MSFAPLSAPAPVGAESAAPEGMEYSKRKWISPLQLWMHSLMAEALWVAMIAVLVLDISAIIVRAIGYSILQKWSADQAVLSLSTTPPLPGLQADLLVTIAYLIMLMALSIDILLSLSLSSRDFEQGVVRTYTIVVVFHIPIMLGYVMFECSAQTAAFLLAACQVTSQSTDCASFVQHTKLASLVPSTLSILLHLVGCIFAWHFVQKEAIRKDRLAHRHLEKIKNPSAKLTKPKFGSGRGGMFGGPPGSPFGSQGYGYPGAGGGGSTPGMGMDSSSKYASDTDSDTPMPAGGPGPMRGAGDRGPGSGQLPPWLVRSAPGNTSRTTVSTASNPSQPLPPTSLPSQMPPRGDLGTMAPPPTLPPANSLGRSRSGSGRRMSGSAALRSLEKPEHKRSGSIADYNRELEESDDEIDALVGDDEGEEDGDEEERVAGRR